MRNPGRRGQHLDFDLFSPVRLACPFQGSAEFLELTQLALRSGRVPTARCAHGTREMGDRLGLRKLAASRLERGCFLPVKALERKTRRNRRQASVTWQRITSELLDPIAVVSNLLGALLLTHLQERIFHEIQ